MYTRLKKQNKHLFRVISHYTLHLQNIASNPEFNSKFIILWAFKICLKLINWNSAVLVVVA